MPSLKLMNISALSLLVLSSTAFAQTDAPVVDQAPEVPTKAFAIPDTIQDFEQLIAFVEEIDNLEPSGSSEQEMAAHHRKIARTVVAAAEKLSSKKISDDDAMQSVHLKLQGLRILQQLGEPNAGELFAKAVDVALADKRPDVQAVGTKFMVESGFGQWATWGEEEKGELINRIAQVISSRKPEGRQVDLVMKLVEFLGKMKDEVFARQLLTKVMPHFQTSKDPEILQLLTLLEGTERRMNLPGNAMKLSGTLLDGSELDWESYRGKVVLVDFSATWCPPCRAEVPHVLKMYEAYHDKGFEVLGISLDKSPEKAEAYIEQMNIPWPTMFSQNPAERWWKHPMAVYYGVSGIPLAILVDREGKVVHMTARGANLGRELRRLLGEPVARLQPQTDTLVRQVSNSPVGN